MIPLKATLLICVIVAVTAQKESEVKKDQKDDKVILRASVSPEKYVRVGEKATITCSLDKLPPKRPLSLMIRKHTGKFVSESCGAYDSAHKTVCYPNEKDFQTAERIIFTIKNVTWEDRYDWYCIYGNTYASAFLNVYDGAEVNSAEVVAFVVNGSILRPARQGGRFQGKGTRTNPFDLRPLGYRLNVTCSTKCGYPAAHFRWSNENSNGSASLNANEWNINCTEAQKVHVISNLTIDCKKMKLIGLNQLSCAAEGDQYSTPQLLSPNALQRSFYFVCPGGERPMTLTIAEIIAIAIGCILAFIFLFIGYAIARKYQRKDYTNMQTHSTGPTLNV